MSLWKSTDQANSAPKYFGVTAKQSNYAQTAAITLTSSTLTTGSSNVTLSSTTGINLNQAITSTTAGVAPGAQVTAVVNSTVIIMSAPFTGTTTSSASVTFKNEGVRGVNLYGNTTIGAFQNNQTVGVFNVLNIPNYVTITANTIAGNNWLTNPVGNFVNSQSGTFTQGSVTVTGLTSNVLATLAVGMSIYSTASNATGVATTWGNTRSIAGLINSTAITLDAASPITNGTATYHFSRIAPRMIASGVGNNLPGLTRDRAGAVTTSITTITGTVSNGTIGSNGNILRVTSFTGPALSPGQEILANSSLAVTNGVFVVSGPSTLGTGDYVLSTNSITNGAAGAPVTLFTVIPQVSFVNATHIVLTGNAYATANGLSNAVSFSSYEKSVFGRSTPAGWTEVRYGTGPVSGFTVNATATTGYSNGETVIISGPTGTIPATGIITTNTQSTTAGANIASVAVLYSGAGFTNTSVLNSATYTRQLHLANVTTSGTPSGATIGDRLTVTATYTLASFTGVVNNNVLTVSSISGTPGTLAIGNIIAGTGVATNTVILAQLSGTAGGNGRYAVNGNQNVPSTTMTTTGQIIAGVANITATSFTNSTITITNQGLFTNGLTTANLIVTYTNSTGGTGTATGVTGLAASFASASAGDPLVVSLGGKSGRIYTETLVALTGASPATENAGDNVNFPNS
jgi:hypothetical protein